jgi:response regulator of citrate/malate metabolism
MFFGKRLWATRIIDQAGMKVSQPIGGELVALIVSLAKQNAKLSRASGVKFSDLDLVIQAALVAASDERSILRLSTATRVSQASARKHLALLFQGAENIAAKNGREGILEVFHEVRN